MCFIFHIISPVVKQLQTSGQEICSSAYSRTCENKLEVVTPEVLTFDLFRYL